MVWNNPEFSAKMDWAVRTILERLVLTLLQLRPYEIEVTPTPQSENFSYPNGIVPSAPPAPLEEEGYSQDYSSIPMEAILKTSNWTRPEPPGEVARQPASRVNRQDLWLDYLVFFCEIFPMLFGLLCFSGLIVFLALRDGYRWLSILPLLLLCGVLYCYGHDYNPCMSSPAEDRANEEAEAIEDNAV